jgi:outer membrane autotransporter protein
LFVEYGSGSYNTYNAFSGADFNGDGDVDHIGGGIIGRMDFVDTKSGHAYVEGSLRAGSVNNDYSGKSDLRDALGRNAGGYDANSPYYGLHAGLGYIATLNDTMSLDLYGKYFWTRMEGDDVTLATGDPISFKDADSHRMRAGSRFAYTEDKSYTHYAGVAYEHEFDGKASATTFGYAIDEPDLEGGTGIAEIGTHIRPVDDLPLSLDVGLQAYAGTRQGVTGSVQFRYEF